MIRRLLVVLAALLAAAAAYVVVRRRARRAARTRRRAQREGRPARSGGRPSTPTPSPEPAGDSEPAAPARPSAAAGVRDEPAEGPARATPGFQSIRGIGPAMEDRLRSAGVESIDRIAAWSDADVETLAPLLRVTPERVRSQRWIEQAQALLSAPAGG